MKTIFLTCLLALYTAYIMSISMKHPQLDYLQTTMYQIMEDSYFIGCKKANGDTSECKAGAKQYRLDLEQTLGTVL